jgi:hypothetical protein
LRSPRDTLYPLKLVLTSPRSGGRSVGRYSSLADSSHGVFTTETYWTHIHYLSLDFALGMLRASGGLVEKQKEIIYATFDLLTVRGNVVGSGTMLQAGRSRVQFPMRSLNFFNLPTPSSRTMTLGSTQPLTKNE